MSRARAPGKAVLSGAYAVLEGGPALVAAVDRWVLADTARPAPLLTAEVAAALAARAREGGGGTAAAPVAPWFDATALREHGQKLGLGSSAAILVASLGALALDEDPTLSDAALAARVFAPALAAHRAAQGGGSGVDVAAACFGGVLRCQRQGAALACAPAALPAGVTLGLWTAGSPASTAALVARVQALLGEHPAEGARLLAAQRAAAEATDQAVQRGDGAAFIAGLAAQRQALEALGRAAGADIVTAEVAALAGLALPLGVAVLPSGAGGGDIVLHASRGPLPAAVQAAAQAAGLHPLALALGARGVHAG